MCRVQGLTIIIAGADPERFHAALSIAAAQAALDRPAALFLQADAVRLLCRPIEAPGDAPYSEVGIPTLSELFAEAKALGVEITACQSGLALAGMTAADLPGGVETGGLVDLLSRRSGDQLLMA